MHTRKKFWGGGWFISKFLVCIQKIITASRGGGGGLCQIFLCVLEKNTRRGGGVIPKFLVCAQRILLRGGGGAIPGNIGLPLRFRSSDNFRKFSRSAESRQNSWIKSDTHFRKRFWSGQTDPNSSDFQSILWHNFSAEKLIKVVLINVLNNYI